MSLPIVVPKNVSKQVVIGFTFGWFRKWHGWHEWQNMATQTQNKTKEKKIFSYSIENCSVS